MEEPKTLIQEPFIQANEKEIIETFLLKWASWYITEKDGAVKWSSVIKEVLGYTEKEFNDQVLEAQNKLNVYEALKRLQQTVKRPVTTAEIISELNGNLAERNIYLHLAKLKKHKEIKEHNIKIAGQEIKLISL
jgi:hypothetical protein